MHTKLDSLIALVAVCCLTVAAFSPQAGAQTAAAAADTQQRLARADHIIKHAVRADANVSVSVTAEAPNPDVHHRLMHKMVFYFPNRVMDIVDIFRVRARFGPGFAVGVRATEAADAYVGSYASVYAGLPGPRMQPMPRPPVGPESLNGAELGLVDATIDGEIGPDYSPTEFGASLHLLLLGVDLDFDPVELGDGIAGIFCVDIRGDDY